MQTLVQETMSIIGKDIKLASEMLRAGNLVGMPTETVYGLAADAANAEALARLFQAKGRPKNHPVIVHLASIEQLCDWAIDIPDIAFTLASNFWPGPLTMIFKKQKHVLLEVTGGQDTVAIRVPKHELALELLQQFQGGVAAPSANRFGRLSPTKAIDVQSEFSGEVSYIIDGGTCSVGIESTIIDLSSGEPRILRPGMLNQNDLKGTGLRLFEKENLNASPRAPGTLKSHYSPTTPVTLLPWNELRPELTRLANENISAAVLSFHKVDEAGDSATNGGACFKQEQWITADQNPVTFARDLYQNLRHLDNLKLDRIIVEAVPKEESWSGIRDRLERASTQE